MLYDARRHRWPRRVPAVVAAIVAGRALGLLARLRDGRAIETLRDAERGELGLNRRDEDPIGFWRQR